MRRVLMIFAALVSLLVFLPRAGWAQGAPLGSEFRANTYTTGHQRERAVATDASGNFVAVWRSEGQDGSAFGVFGQRYASSGAPLGPEFRVNSYTTNSQYHPSVGADSSGNFVVVWKSVAQYGAFGPIMGQRFASSGAPLGTEFRVNTNTTNGPRLPVLAADAAGNFLVVWIADDGAPGDVNLFAQRFAAAGAPLGPQFRVNTWTTFPQGDQAVAADASGTFVVVWRSDWQDGLYGGIFGRRFAGTGAPLGPEFQVNTYAYDNQINPSVAAGSSGDFVVVWQSYTQDGSIWGVFGQRYASSGAPLGPEFRVNTYTTDTQGHPAVAADAAGDFVVVWGGYSQDGYNAGLFGQRFLGSGAPLGPEFRVNTYTTYNQYISSVAAGPSANFVVVWQSYGQDGSGYGVFAQRFGAIVPVELMHFRVD